MRPFRVAQAKKPRCQPVGAGRSWTPQKERSKTARARRTDVARFLGLTAYKFRYKANVEALGDEAPWDYGLIA